MPMPMPMPMRILALLLAALMSGCASIGYYSQAVRGHGSLMGASIQVDQLLEQPGTPEDLRQRLILAQSIRDFASQALALPDNDSYRSYAELDRDYVVWNVVAAPEFSLQPRTWCFLFVGCLGYRGYFREEAAQRTAARLEQKGYDVLVGGVAAYSTLGRFDDPLTDVMLNRNDASLAELIFHELAHQQLYVRDDTSFNEAYASFVGEEGLRHWLRAQGDNETLAAWQGRQRRAERFDGLVRAIRAELVDLYASELPKDEMRGQKTAILDGMRARFDTMAAADPQMAPWAGWFEFPVNNARLAGISTYRRWVPAFERLFQEQEEEWVAFHAAAAEIGALPEPERRRHMRELLAKAEGQDEEGRQPRAARGRS
jgi:predicted aminopeptidase